jgi:hypothetical protein
MDIPDSGSTQANLERLLHRSREVAISFVFIEMMTGLSSCQLIRNSRMMTELEKAWHLAYACKALEVAEAVMWRIEMVHPEFDQMMALAERLKFEVQALQTT